MKKPLFHSLAIGAALAGSALVGLGAAPALAQQTYPTAAGNSVRAPGTVPLQCNAGGTACAPVTAANPLQVSVSGGAATQVVGNVASSAADSGNPVKMGGKYNSIGYINPQLTDGMRGDLQVNASGALRVEINNDLNQRAIISTPTDALAAQSALASTGFTMLYNGTSWDRVRGDLNGMVIQRGLTASRWSYANGATGILTNTTVAVTMKAAAGASVRNYIDSCQINTTAFGAASPIAIRDGAAGAVLWAGNVPLAGWLTPVTMAFEMPLQGTANTLVEVVTTTANASGSAYVNCQGHTGP